MRKSDDRACIEYGLCHHMYHNDKKGRMHMLELIKITKKFGEDKVILNIQVIFNSLPDILRRAQQK